MDRKKCGQDIMRLFGKHGEKLYTPKLKVCSHSYGVYAIPYDSCNAGLAYFDNSLTVEGVDEEYEGSVRFDFCPWCGECINGELNASISK